MTPEMKKHLEAVVVAIANEQSTDAKSEFSKYLRLKTQEVLLGEKEEKDEDDKDDKDEDKDDKKDDDKKDEDKDEDKDDEDKDDKKGKKAPPFVKKDKEDKE